MSTISAGTTSTTALVSTGDTTGNLVLATGSVPTTALTLNSTTQAATFAGTLATASQGIASASMPVGSVIQVVNAIYSTATSSSTSTPIATGLTASITPKFSTSKILILISHAENFKSTANAGNDIGFWLYKNGSSLIQFASDLGYTGTATQLNFSASFNYVDSPATTSALTYATYFSSRNSNAGVVQTQTANTPATIILMEIAA